MAYLLNSTTIRAPLSMAERNSTQLAQHRTLNGSIRRDYIGSNKRMWILSYENVKKEDFDTINTIYQSYLTTGSTKSWQVTETNYTVSSVNVHVDLLVREFTVRGSSYISDFDLILTEA